MAPRGSTAAATSFPFSRISLPEIALQSPCATARGDVPHRTASSTTIEAVAGAVLQVLGHGASAGHELRRGAARLVHAAWHQARAW